MAEIAVKTDHVEAQATRRESGVLPREMGFVGVFVFTVSSIGLAFCGLNLFSSIPGMLPGVNLLGIVSIAMVVTLLHVYLFSVIGTLAPRIGADYVIGSRVLSPRIAFAFSFTLVVFLSWFAGMVLTSIPLTTLKELGRALDFVGGSSMYSESIAWAKSPSTIVSISTVSILSIFLILILPSRINRLFFRISCIVLLLTCGILFYQLASAPVDSFPAAYNAAIGLNQYEAHLEEAKQLGMQMIDSPIPMVIAGLMFGYWIFYGYANPALIAGEVKNPAKNLGWGSAAGMLFSYAILVITILLLQRVIPPEWLSAESFLYQSSTYQGKVMPWVVFYGAVLYPNRLLVMLIGIGWFFTIFTLAHALLYTASRLVLAWSRDNLLPEGVSFVHPSLRSPLIAVLLVCIVAVVGIVDYAVSEGTRLTSFNAIMFLVLTQVMPILSVTLLPFLKRDWFETAPSFVRMKIGPLPVVSLAGCVSLLYMVIVIIATSQVSIFASTTLFTIVIFAIIFSVGLVWFNARRSYLHSQGKDIQLHFKQLPEE